MAMNQRSNNEKKKVKKRDYWYSDCKLVVNQIMEVKMSTKRSPAYIKIALDDETASTAMDHMKTAHGYNGLFHPYAMAGLSLCWTDQRKEESYESNK